MVGPILSGTITEQLPSKHRGEMSPIPRYFIQIKRKSVYTERAHYEALPGWLPCGLSEAILYYCPPSLSFPQWSCYSLTIRRGTWAPTLELLIHLSREPASWLISSSQVFTQMLLSARLTLPYTATPLPSVHSSNLFLSNSALFFP